MFVFVTESYLRCYRVTVMVLQSSMCYRETAMVYQSKALTAIKSFFAVRCGPCPALGSSVFSKRPPCCLSRVQSNRSISPCCLSHVRSSRSIYFERPAPFHPPAPALGGLSLAAACPPQAPMCLMAAHPQCVRARTCPLPLAP
jgi:hypothetical protein